MTLHSSSTSAFMDSIIDQQRRKALAIIDAVGSQFGFNRAQIMGRKRTPSLIWARHVAMTLCHDFVWPERTNRCRLKEIFRRKLEMIDYARKKVESLTSTNRSMLAEFNQIKSLVEKL
jgi:chromosomal replication initiation ATPase DnaA